MVIHWSLKLVAHKLLYLSHALCLMAGHVACLWTNAYNYDRLIDTAIGLQV